MVVWVALLIWITVVKGYLGSLRSDKQKKLFLLLSGMGVVFVMGARYADPSMRGDLNNYTRMYQIILETPWNKVMSMYSNIESGYRIFNKICSMVLPWTQSIVFIEAFICVYFTFRFIYLNSDDVYLAVLMYLTQGLFIFELTGFRQAIAISLCLYSIEFVKKRNIFGFLITVALACSFHTTAIVFLPIYFIANFRPSMKNGILYGIGYYLLLRMIPNLLLWGSDLTGSDYSVASSWGNFTGPAINIVIYVVAMWLILRENKIICKTGSEIGYGTNNWRWNMAILGLIVYLLRFISLPFERISFYFSASTIVTIPDRIIPIFSDNSKKVAYILIVLLLSFLFLYRLHGTGASIYRFFWTK